MDPAILFTKKSNTPLEAEADGGEAMARKEVLATSGRRSWRYWPARVWEATRTGESETSIDTWKSDSAAGRTLASGAGVQTAVSWRRAAETENSRRGERVRWRRMVAMRGRTLVGEGTWEQK